LFSAASGHESKDLQRLFIEFVEGVRLGYRKMARKGSPMTYQTLIYSVEKDIVGITINRPAQLNAIDVLTAKELALAAKQCSPDPAVRGVVLTGAGDRAFCAGGDVAGFA
jgi:1,4-dihydroxy-2-naphthoyl-CoA synthase